MKKTLRQVLLAGLMASAGWASAASSSVADNTLSFSTVSGTSFLNSLLVTPTTDNAFFVSVFGGLTQFSSLSFQIDGGTTVSATDKGGILTATFNDKANSALGNAYQLLAGQSYVLTVTGVTKGLSDGVTGNYSLTFRNGSVSALPVIPSVPEPETWAMLLAGLGFVGVLARRRANKV